VDVKERKFWTCHDPVERSERIHLSHPDQTGSITVVLSTTVAHQFIFIMLTNLVIAFEFTVQLHD